MYLFIMRHGEAAPDVASDKNRSLMPSGRQHVHQAAVWLAHQSVHIEQVLVSPYLRTRQTLMAVREILPLPEEEILSGLTPDADSADMGRHLRKLAAEYCEAVLLISHLPFISALITELCPTAVIPTFHTADIAYIELNITREHTRLIQLYQSPAADR